MQHEVHGTFDVGAGQFTGGWINGRGKKRKRQERRGG
jgi:hypothetical protein